MSDGSLLPGLHYLVSEGLNRQGSAHWLVFSMYEAVFGMT